MKTLACQFGHTPALASIRSQRLQDFLSSLLRCLNRLLAKTFAATISILLEQRHRASGFLLTDLGAFLAGAEQAPAGTKRLSNLLRSNRWTHSLLDDFLWQRADQWVRDLVCRARQPLLLWDKSLLEKPESIAPEDLGSVRSAKPQRLRKKMIAFQLRTSQPGRIRARPSFHLRPPLDLAAARQRGRRHRLTEMLAVPNAIPKSQARSTRSCSWCAFPR